MVFSNTGIRFVESTNCFAYASVFGAEFPGNTGQGINIGQLRDTYFTMEFSTAGTDRKQWAVDIRKSADFADLYGPETHDDFGMPRRF